MPHSNKIKKALREITWDFHVRAFGEERARVNFLPPAQRRRYVQRLRARAAKNAPSLNEGEFLPG
jgi:hypothetical protein